MKLTLLLIPLILLSSCTIDWNDEKDKKIAELEKQVTELKTKNDDNLFKKKQECAEYNKDYDEKEGVLGNQAFYSKKYNTCFIAFGALIGEAGNSNSAINYIINNLLDGENVFQKYVSNKDGELAWKNAEMEFENKIQELKGE